MINSDLYLLEQYGVAWIPHSGATLLSHLVGTCELLERWGSSRAVCLAGLYHGVYGTEESPRTTIPLSERGRVRDAIGEEAEALVHLFYVGRRPFLMTLNASEKMVINRLSGEQIAVTGEQLHYLLEMEVANWVQLMPRYSMHDEMLDRFAVAVEAWKKFISLNAYRAMQYSLMNKYHQSPALYRQAGHVLTSRSRRLRKIIRRIRHWRDKR